MATNKIVCLRMELAKSVLDGLSTMRNEELFKSLVELCCKTLKDGKFPLDKHLQELIKVAPADLGEVNMVCRCIMTVLVESARHDCDPTAYLDQHAVWPPAVTALSDAHASHGRHVRLVLSHINSACDGGTMLRHVVDVEWRLQYVASSGGVERVNEPRYLVTLHTDGGATRDAACDARDTRGAVELSCGVEHLQDMVGKLKEACKAVERVAASGGAGGSQGT